MGGRHREKTVVKVGLNHSREVKRWTVSEELGEVSLNVL